MSGLIENYRLLKKTCDANVAAAALQETQVKTVNLKGELLVGDGSGPTQLDPTTGSDDQLLTFNSATSVGVQWSTLSPLLPIVQGGYQLFDNVSGTILPEWNNYYVEIKTDVNPVTLTLPSMSGLTNGFTLFIHTNTIVASGIRTEIGNNIGAIENSGILGSSVTSSVPEFAKFVYNADQLRWSILKIEDVSV
jgi:hypothetical protein